ncbi:MAG TPA: class II aldolase/adducin family protein [Mycobacteriales bacterium]|nr:class II aldolase/adducin family protein [Mycobacteriales bacterium]
MPPKSGGTPQEQVFDACKKMLRVGLTGGTSGNISVKIDDNSVAISPSSVDYEDMTLEDIVVIDMEGKKLDGELAPSSEWKLHTECYKLYPEISSCVHTHPLYASMFAVARQPIPAVLDEFVIYTGGEVPVSEYAMSGTPELAVNVALKLKGVSTALIANHGMTSIASSADKALHHSWVVERNAHIIWGARMLGEVHEVPASTNDMLGGMYKYLRENGKS